YCYAHLPDLHSFPTRRSSDLNLKMHELRYAVRILVRNPGFTTIAALALAVGIGANTAIFSIVNVTLMRPLPYRNAERLVMIWDRSEEHTSELQSRGHLVCRLL